MCDEIQSVFSQLFDVLSIGCSRCFILHDSLSVNEGSHARYPRRGQRRASTHYRLRIATYPVSRKPSAATMQNYDIIVCFPSRKALYHCVGYICFALKLGNKYLPVKALVLPPQGPDAMLIDISIMKALEAKLDWAAEQLSFEDSKVTIPATHMKRPIRSKYCSVITQDSTQKRFLCLFLISTLSQSHMKHSFVFSVRHSLKKIR